MNNKVNTHNRHSIRLHGYNYSQPGAYFVTICTQNHSRLFGHIENGKMIYNELGEIAYNVWKKLPNRFHNIEMDVFQIMPNHMHGILIIGGNNIVDSITNKPVGPSLADAHENVDGSITNNWAGASPAPTATAPPTVGDIVGAYKSLVMHECLKIYKSENKCLGENMATELL